MSSDDSCWLSQTAFVVLMAGELEGEVPPAEHGDV
jgi:hypothetical protein